MAVRHSRLCLPGAGRLHRFGRRCYPHLHPGDADGAQRRQAGHRPQPGAAQLERHQLHPHLRRGRPTAGALTVNTVAASGGGTQSYDSDGTFTIGTRTDYADAASGLASSTLTREQGTLSADACSAYGAPTTLVGTPAQSGLATGCYRYVLTGTDNVGNTDDDHHGGQGRHQRAGGTRPDALRLQRRRPHHRHHRLLPARRHRLLRRHRVVDRRAVRDPRLQLPRPGRLHRFGRRRDPHLHPGHADRAQRRQARHRPQPGAAQLERHQLHPHLGRRGTHWRRPHSEYRRRERRRYPELRRRRRVHDRSAHRLHGCALRARDFDADARAGHLNADACSAYGAPTTLVGTPAQSGLATGCYRYALTGTDNVGNAARSRPSSRSTPARRRHPAWCSPTPAPTCTQLARLLSTGRPAQAPSTSPRRRPTPSPGSSTTASRRWPASPAPAPAPPAPTPWRRRPSPTAPSRSPPATRRCSARPPPTSPSPPTRPPRPAAR